MSAIVNNNTNDVKYYEDKVAIMSSKVLTASGTVLLGEYKKLYFYHGFVDSLKIEECFRGDCVPCEEPSCDKTCENLRKT